MPTPPQSTELATRPVSSLTVHRQSVQTGAFEFIPLPFVDDWLIRRERRLLVKKVFTQRGLSFEPGVPKSLADGGAKTFMGRLGSIAKSLVLKPLKKVLRTFFFWLTIRRAVLTMMETYFLARFANLPEVGATGERITVAEAEQWGKIFFTTVAKADSRMAREGTKHLWAWLKEKKQETSEQGEAVSQQEVEDVLEKEAPGILADFDRRAREGLQAVSRQV